MMNTFVIAGGNSGIDLQAAREILAAGHRIIIWGMTSRKVRNQ
jgi:short-subunit dehydrogenase involved in D-alanine esterification of teichoic acids